ncbi:hypothetical protein [Streptomyces sp. BH055]|uniref:hypothetical protein n=1 Tax=Streptomyces sp. BH055 TaxID=3401173 RepID=UPI003BB69F03
MTTQVTEPSGPISAMSTALEVLARLIEQHPTLPDAYIVIHAPFRRFPSRFDLQLRNTSEFETWREALGIDPEDVELHAPGANSWLDATTKVDGVQVDISGHGLGITPEQAVEPRTLRPATDFQPVPLAQSLAAEVTA